MASRVVIQVVDGGVLRQIQLEKTSPAYRAIMAVFDAERQTQLRNRAQTTRSNSAIPSNPPARRREQPPLELDDGSTSDVSHSSLNESDTTAVESDSDEDEQLRHASKQRKTQQNKRFTCVECGHAFRDGYHLRQHMRTHTREKPYKCKDCGKTFAHLSTCCMHERTHTGKKPYKCVVCSKTFSQDSNRRVHERTHSGEKPYKCEVCGKAFARSSIRWIHERTHTGEKPHKCVVCGKGFSQGSHRQVHERTHTGEKPYKCDVCAKTFARIDRLRMHEKTHHPVVGPSEKAKSKAAKSRRTLEE